LPVSLMAVSLFAVNKGYFDDIEIKQVLPFESALHKSLKAKNAALLDKIDSTKQLDKDGEKELGDAIAEFKKSGTY
jgi:F-type H+-transporting ATPase subunit alpha